VDDLAHFWHTPAHTRDDFSAFLEAVDNQLQARLGARRPTARQIYALAAALCERLGEEFPPSSAAASELIERLRRENGHPAPALEDSPVRRRPREL
jgi:hypothetical protein